MEIENDNVKHRAMPELLGKNNPRWNNDASHYKDHHQMKLNRLVKLQQTKGKCEVCGIDAKTIHHIDGSNDNHRISNLTVLCNKHHSLIHNIDGVRQYKTSKFIRKYGMSLKEMSIKLQRPETYIWLGLKKDAKKKEILEKLGITENKEAI